MRNLLTSLTRPFTRPAAPAAAEPVDPLAAAEAAEADTLLARAEAERRAVINKARIAEAEAAAKIATIEAKAKADRERRDARAAEDRTLAAAAARETQEAARRAQRAERGRTLRVKIAHWGERGRRLAVNLIVNIGAGVGQALFLHKQQHVPLPFAVLLAAGVELVAVTTLDYGIAARKHGRPYTLKFATAGLLASVVAATNYAHWSASTQQQGLAIPLAIMSLLCPLLWAWYAAARDAETAPVLQVAAPPARRSTPAARQQHAGNADQHAISTQQHANSTGQHRAARFTILQWLLWPVPTLAAKRHAIRYGIDDPQEAYRAAGQHAADIEAGKRVRERAARQDLAEAEAYLADAEHTISVERLAAADEREQHAAVMAELQAELGQTHELLAARQRELAGSSVLDRYLPTPDEVAEMTSDEKKESARDAAMQARLDGVELHGPTIATTYKRSPSWARAILREVKSSVVRGELADDRDELADDLDEDLDDSGDEDRERAAQ